VFPLAWVRFLNLHILSMPRFVAGRIRSTRIESQSTSDQLISAGTLCGCDWCTVTRGHISFPFLQSPHQSNIGSSYRSTYSPRSLYDVYDTRGCFLVALGPPGAINRVCLGEQREREIYDSNIEQSMLPATKTNTYTATDKQVANNARWHQREEVDVRISTFCIRTSASDSWLYIIIYNYI